MGIKNAIIKTYYLVELPSVKVYLDGDRKLLGYKRQLGVLDGPEPSTYDELDDMVQVNGFWLLFDNRLWSNILDWIIHVNCHAVQT